MVVNISPPAKTWHTSTNINTKISAWQICLFIRANGILHVHMITALRFYWVSLLINDIGQYWCRNFHITTNNFTSQHLLWALYFSADIISPVSWKKINKNTSLKNYYASKKWPTCISKILGGTKFAPCSLGLNNQRQVYQGETQGCNFLLGWFSFLS